MLLLIKLILIPVLFIWGVIRSLQKGEFLKWLFDLLLAFDRWANVLGKYTFNDIMGDNFGNGKETISGRLGKNEMFFSLKPIGKILANILNRLDKDHCKKAIDFII